MAEISEDKQQQKPGDLELTLFFKITECHYKFGNLKNMSQNLCKPWLHDEPLRNTVIRQDSRLQ